MIRAATRRRASARGSAASARRVVLARARGLEREQRLHLGRADAVARVQRLRAEIPFGDAEAREIVERQVDAAAREVAGDVAQDVGQLQRDAEIDRVLLARRDPGSRRSRTHISPTAEATRMQYSVELLERLVAPPVQVHLDAVDQRLEGRRGRSNGGDERLQRAPLRRLRRRRRRNSAPPRRATRALRACAAAPPAPRPPRRRRRGRNPRRRRSRAACRPAGRGTSSRSWCLVPLRSAIVVPRRQPSLPRTACATGSTARRPASAPAGARRRRSSPLPAYPESACRQARSRAARSAGGRGRRRRRDGRRRRARACARPPSASAARQAGVIRRRRDPRARAPAVCQIDAGT